jgi:hypothetical protein
MPSTTHQALVELFRVRPALAAELIARTALARLPAFATASSTEAALDQLVPVEFRADLVIELFDRAGVLIGAIVVEVQLGKDDDKPWTWPVYATAVRARKRCPVWLLVIAPDEAVALWASRPIELAPGAPCLAPVVLGPSEFPAITDPAVAVRHPELTLLAAVAHGHDEVAERLIPALPAVLHALDAEHRAGYLSMLLEALAPAFRKRLEELMVHPSFAAIKLPSPWQEILDDTRIKAQHDGEARGKADGEARGKADAVLSVLSARDIAVSNEIRSQILACNDVPTLDRWLRRAATLKTAAAVVRGPAATRPPTRR